jgi:uncharacterized protein YndB with AHSA1/START domain
MATASLNSKRVPNGGAAALRSARAAAYSRAIRVAAPLASHTEAALMSELAFNVERQIVLRAPRAAVFAYFTDSARWAAWWGAGSTIEPRPGGALTIVHPDGTRAGGRVVEIAPPDRIVFTFGYESGVPMPVGGSRLTIRLVPVGDATRLELRQDVATADVRALHEQGWRYQLSVLANVVQDALHAAAHEVVDAWYAAWADPDASARRGAFERIATPDVQFRDRYSALDGIDDLLEHVQASQRFMPGVRLTRDGDVRHCQGVVLSDWTACSPDRAIGRGTSVFVFGPSGRLESVTGLWNRAEAEPSASA